MCMHTGMLVGGHAPLPITVTAALTAAVFQVFQAYFVHHNNGCRQE